MEASPLASRAEREAVFQREVRARLLRNYSAQLVHGLLGQTGFRLVQAPTFIPAYVHAISGSDIAVGLARSLQALGMFLSPVLGATVIEHRRRVLPAGLVFGLLMRVQLLGIALAGFWLAPGWNLVAICAFLGLFGFFLGIQGVVFQFLVSKVIPVEVRGVLLGLRNALAGLSAAGVGVLGGRWIDGNALGNGYATTFLVAFALASAGLAVLSLVSEPDSPEVRPAARFHDRLRDLPALLRSDPGFTRYFLVRALATMGRTAVPFYVLYAGTRTQISGVQLGVLTAAFLLAQTTLNALWGIVADRRGFRLVFLTSLAVWILAALMLFWSTTFASLTLVFCGLGAGLGGFTLSAQNLALEFGSRHNLPMRIAVANSASELVGAVGPLLGGVLAAFGSYVVVIWTAVTFQTMAWLIALRAVPEPRRRAR